MKGQRSIAKVLMVVGSLVLATVTLTKAQDRHDHFNDHDRQVSRDWYRAHHDYFHHDEGRYWHRAWEPNIRAGFVLTPGMRAAIRPAPAELIAGYGPPPPGYRYVVIGDHVCLIDRGYRIHDVLHFELNF